MVKVMSVPWWGVESSFEVLKEYLELPWVSGNKGPSEYTILGLVEEPVPQIFVGKA